MYTDYSVLMSVYYKERGPYLDEAISSMLKQTLLTNDFVIVCDGPLTSELEQVIEKYRNLYPSIFQIIKLNKNQGLGNALRIGVTKCKNELIARMDSDDISLPIRCKLQVQAFNRNPDIALCGGYIAEFDKSIQAISGIRKVPLSSKDILQFAKKRNPMNHMTVMFKKDAVLTVGNYIELNLAEDYYLWVRILMNNFKAINLDRVLVYARTGADMYRRRGGLAYAGKLIILQKTFLKSGFITIHEFCLNCFVRIVTSLVPSGLRGLIYKSFLR